MADTSIDLHNDASIRDELIEETATNTLSPNIYDIATYIDAIKAKYIDLPEDTLAMGIYGYLSEIHANILENTAIIAAEYANESIPTKAQFERNVISHALSLGIDNIRAVPASMNVYLCLPESDVIANMVNNTLTIDKEFVINLNDSTNNSFSYLLDYDIILHRSILPNGKYIYTAIYNIDEHNEISNITSPYLPTIGDIIISNDNFLMINTRIRQVVHTKIYKTILVSNPIESKVITFNFSDQLSYFYVEVEEGDETHYLTCIYDGLYETNPDQEYCNYQYIDDNTIRITFNRDSYQPRNNASITIHVYTTKGSSGNFTYTSQPVYTLTSERFSYNSLYMVLQPISDSENGLDRKSVEDLHEAIPKEMLSRNSITTTKDLVGYFNQISENYRMHFLQKAHNQLSRIFFGYILLKNTNNNVIPTNTLDVTFGKEAFFNINRVNYILPQGSIFYCDGETTTGLPNNISDDDLAKYEGNGFLYTNPFMVVINKNPFLVSYYLNILNYGKSVNFEYINDASQLQFIPDSLIRVRRESMSKDLNTRNIYRINITLMQNIASDFNIIATDEKSNITRQDIQVYAVFYRSNSSDSNDTPYRWCKANPLIAGDYDDSQYIYNFEIDFSTTDIIDRNGNMTINKGLYNIADSGKKDSLSYLPGNFPVKFFVLYKLEDEYGRGDEIDSIIPGLDGWTLSNAYSMNTGMDIYYDYTNIMESYVSIHLDKTSGETIFDLKRLPMVKYSYMNTSDRIESFMKVLDTRRSYIQACLILLEDSFGVDFKFFNTYGPSKMYNVNEEVPLDRVNISLKFELKYQTLDDINITGDITAFIKEYIENLNYITELHIPNLCTAVKNKFVKQLVYFKFVGLNNYGYMYQSIYDNPNPDIYVDSTFVPEFININTLDGDVPDITYTVAKADQADIVSNNII